MADDLFNSERVANLKLRDFADEYRRGTELPPVRQPAAARAGSAATSPLAMAARLIEQRRRAQRAGLLGGGGASEQQLPSFETVRAQWQGFDDLPYDEQSRIYGEFMTQATDQFRAANPDADDNAIFGFQDALSTANPAPARPTRSWLGAAADVGAGGLAGALGLLSAGASAVSPGGPSATLLQRGAEGLRATQSLVEQDARRQQAFELAQLAQQDMGVVERLAREAGISLSNLSAGQIAELAGNIAPLVALSGGTGLAARGLAAAGGASRGAAAATGRRVATGTGVAASGVLGGGDAAQQAYDEIMGLDDDTLQAYPEWQQALGDADGDAQRAREALATRTARIAQGYATLSSTALASLPIALPRTIGRAVAGEASAPSIGRAALARAGEGAVGALDEAGAGIAARYATGGVTGDRSIERLLEGAGADAVLGALGDGIGGGIATAAQRFTGGTAASAPDALPAPVAPTPTGGPETIVVGGSTLIRPTPADPWQYAPDSPVSPEADEVIRVTGGEPAPAPAEPVSPPAEPLTPAPQPVPPMEPAPDSLPSVPEPAQPAPDAVVAPAEPTPEPEAPTPAVEPTAVAAAFDAAIEQALSDARRRRANDVVRTRWNASVGGITPADAAAISNTIEAMDTASAAQLGQALTALENVTRRETTAEPGVAAMLRNVVRIHPTPIGPDAGSPAGYLVTTFGSQLQTKHLPASERWVPLLRQGAGARQILLAMENSQHAGRFGRALAAGLRQVYDTSGTPYPSVSYSQAIPGSPRTLAAYADATHRVTGTAKSTANAVLHEMMHGLTTRGLLKISEDASSGNRSAQDILALFDELRAKLQTEAASRNWRPYGANADYRVGGGRGRSRVRTDNFGEAIAELTDPAFLALAASVPVGDLSPAATRALQTVTTARPETVLAALIDMVQAVLKYLSPNATVPKDSIASALLQSAAYANSLQNARSDTSAAGADVIVGSQEETPAEVRAEQLNQGADNVLGESEDYSASSPRTDPTTHVANILNGVPADYATSGRVFGAALGRFMRTGDDASVRGMRKAIVAGGERLNVLLHDHLAPVKRWFQGLPIGDTTAGQEVIDRANNALYTAVGVRDSRLQTASREYGGDAVRRMLAEASSRHNISIETARLWMGTWVTASYAADGNAKLIAKDAQRVAQARTAGDADALAQAVRQLQRRIAAVNDPNPNPEGRKAAGVAGYSNATAAALMASIEQRIPRAELQQLAEQIYTLNGWALVTDVESGKVPPAVVAEFLGRDVEDMLRSLRNAALAFNAENQESVRARDAIRAEVMAAIRSRYVPLTGDPSVALETDTFQQGGRRPNTSRDYALDGRRDSVPDDAITATWARVLRSANYAGWAPFQDAVSSVYDALTPEQREQVGISRSTLPADSSAVGENAIIRRRGNTVHAFSFRDRGILEAIRGANVDDANANLQVLGMPTKWYAYAATQLNLMFAPRNYIRDLWEKSELIRSKRILGADGQPIDTTRVARGIYGYTLNPAKASEAMVAAWRMAAGRPVNTNSRSARLLREFMDLGGLSVYGDRFAGSKTELVEQVAKQQGLRRAAGSIGRMVDIYNRSFDTVPALAAFMALRDQGASPQVAAAEALDLMNFRKRGAAAGFFGALYAFAQPAFTGGANALSAIYNPHSRAEKLGGTHLVKRGVVRLMGTTLMFSAIHAMARAIMDDDTDEGGNPLDQVNELTQNNNLVFPVGDNGFIKIPLAFGLTRVAHGMALNMSGVASGELTPGEAFGKQVTGSLVPVFSPIEGVDVDWSRRPTQAFLLTFSPSWLKPVVSVAVNRTANDAPVVFDTYEKTDEFRSEQFGRNVPEVYREVARFLRRSTGDRLDLAPEEIKALVEGYPMGSLSMVRTSLIDNPFREEQGRPYQNPLLSQIYGVYTDGGKLSQFYEALEATNSLLRRRTAGSELSEDDRKLLAWRAAWDDIDNDLRAQVRRINRDRSLSEEGKARRLATQLELRRRQQVLAVYRYRQARGLEAERVLVPGALLDTSRR